MGFGVACIGVPADIRAPGVLPVVWSNCIAACLQHSLVLVVLSATCVSVGQGAKGSA
eukprot:CAMPEP_0174385260 /NCGR_PEP_ID=MMETSP0811_2-20130205/126477_1 /TAXON_ID=73025 ORGANISM="Eutreptiella gymnastica-like, Strain CCMP1594" /NCGR_SAMPLE_ID=MMETSP0811_2 /ASSEMBLY_ACC=CAM_ASM_000667 /LENGTH=56 /DNA_ID=CAMNT_0015539511 /DNA_START=1051 /DNA_END=1221 /DNA_ORIENTATION=+